MLKPVIQPHVRDRKASVLVRVLAYRSSHSVLWASATSFEDKHRRRLPQISVLSSVASLVSQSVAYAGFLRLQVCLVFSKVQSLMC